MTIQQAIRIIQAARNRGDRYAGRYVTDAARELVRVSGKEHPEYHKLAYEALREIDKGRSLLECIELKGVQS